MRRASFWLPGWFASFATWEQIFTEYFMALHQFERAGDEDSLKSAINTKIGGPYWSVADKTAADGGAALSDRIESTWLRHHAPAGIRTVTAVVDVQKLSFEVAIIGRGQDNERWIMDRFSIRHTKAGDQIKPSRIAEHWNAITDGVLLNTYNIAGSDMWFRVHVMAIDSGGAEGTSERAYDYWRSLPKPLKNRVLLVKGVATHGGRGLTRLTRPDSRGRKDRPTGGRGDVPVLEIRSNPAKDALSNDLARDQPGRGFVHIPRWLSATHIDELNSERRDERGRWTRIGMKRNELWDHMYYEHGVWVHNSAGDNVRWDRPKPWLMIPEQNSDVLSAEQKTMMREPVRAKTKKRGKPQLRMPMLIR
jgi:phage terminase large subunit GpA-like protein